MISPKTIEFEAYRGTGPARHTLFKGGPVKFVATLDNSIDLTGCTSLRLDIRESATDTNNPLASEEITSFDGYIYEFEFSTAQTNQTITSGWLVLSAYYPEGVGDTDDNLDPLYIAELTFVPHNASLLAPQPPNAAVALTQDAADARYLRSDTLSTSEGGNGVADAGKLAIFDLDGALSSSDDIYLYEGGGSGYITLRIGSVLGPNVLTIPGEDGTLATQEHVSTQLSSFTGNVNINTVGTISSGSWNGGVIGVDFGGTGQSTIVDAFGALSVGGGLGRTFYLVDEFLGTSTSSGGIGTLGWGGSGTGSSQGSVANHPGIFRITTAGTGALFLGYLAGSGMSTFNGVTMTGVFRLTSITNVKAAFGLSYVNSWLTNGFKGLHYDSSLSANWRLLHYTQAGVATYTDTGKAAVANDWVRVTLSFASGTTTCTIATTSSSSDATVSNSGADTHTTLGHTIQFTIQSTSGSKEIDVDWFGMSGSTTRL